MAWIERRGNQFHLGIRIGTQKLKRTLQTEDEKEADDLARSRGSRHRRRVGVDRRRPGAGAAAKGVTGSQGDRVTG